jgi:predicted P-loop ATPase
VLQNNRKITITIGNSRKETNWRREVLWLAEFCDKLRTPVRHSVTLAEYLKLPKAQQDDLKDVGGYMAGTLRGSRRKAGAVVCRDIVTLDLDNIPAGSKDDVLRRLEALGCFVAAHPTCKYHPSAPRLRVFIPTDRPVTPDEYEAIARKVAEIIGLDLCDPSTFEPHRLMYYPSVCADSEYFLYCADKPFMCADAMLAQYTDWRNASAWPRLPGAENPARLAAKQGDPESKNGVVGAFCRTYDIPAALDKFLTGIYDPVDNSDGRYTFTGGSTTGGAVLYDNSKFLYSHHAADPCGGRLVNAFDLVRLHKFGDMDDAAEAGTPPVRLPSFAAMCELAAGDAAVSSLIAKERKDAVMADFGGLTTGVEEDDPAWLEKLEKHPKTGLPLATIDNVWLILEHDPLLKGRFALNEFSARGEVLQAPPWPKSDSSKAWDDSDIAGLYWYLEKAYQISSNGKVDNAMMIHSLKHRFNEVTAYLDGLVWDGVPRLDTLFVDYLGAADNPYTRAVARKAFVAAVARAFKPGMKFDTITVLGSQAQGIGKSTLLAVMFGKWFTDALRTFEGKEMGEMLQGVWGLEIAELDALRRTDENRVKLVLSMTVDRFRAAYGRTVKEFPRRCVFFGTTNSHEYLRDKTGNRRFWPVDCGTIPREQFNKVVPGNLKDMRTHLDQERDQLWAEAVHYWRQGESLELEGEAAAEAQRQQEGHREVSAREGIILDFIAREVPEGWNAWPLERRRMYWAGGVSGELKTVPRERVCALEIWCEALGGQIKDCRYGDSAEINAVIMAAEQWGTTKAGKFGYCGLQKGFFAVTLGK